MSPVLGYWKTRGLTHPIRLILEFAGDPYTEKHYIHYDRKEWENEKFNLGLDFPNLPYLIDGDVKLSQSSAILRYLARKYRLDGCTEQEKQRLEMLEYQVTDDKWVFFKICYFSSDYEKDRKNYIEETLPVILRRYSEFLGNRKWFAGENLTYVDFMLAEFLDVKHIFHPECWYQFDNLKDFHKRFYSLETISKYIRSENYIKEEVHSPFADWWGAKCN